MGFIKNFIFSLSTLIPDRLYLQLISRHSLWYRIDFKNPKTFNEKLQRLKLYNRNSDYTKMVDKCDAKKYVSSIIWERYIIPTLWVYNTFDEIDFDKLPNQFVIKCTHDSGGIVICQNKKEFNKSLARKKIEKNLKNNYYIYAREWVYKNIKPRIIVEKYMVDESWVELKDYKVFCFNGEPKIIQVDFDRFKGHKRNIYNLNWEILPFEILYPSDKSHKINKPKCLEEMIYLAKKLSKNIPHVRIDFYIINNQIYFWEMTFYHGWWFEDFRPREWDYKFWEWIKLPDFITN